MSYSVDLNVLLYASNRDSVHHARAISFLTDRVNDTEIFVLAFPTLFGYLRISTHPSIFPRPLEPEQALKNIQQLVARPQVRLISEGDDFLTHYEDVTRHLPVRGNLVPDGHLAALLQAHGVKTLYTNDADFLKFPFLHVQNPFS